MLFTFTAVMGNPANQDFINPYQYNWVTMQGAKYYDGHLTTHNIDIVNPFFVNVKAIIFLFSTLLTNPNGLNQSYRARLLIR